MLMFPIYWFFLRTALEDEKRANPICTDVFIGDIGEYVEIDGVGYYIDDYAFEVHSYAEMGR